jgi:hypothetical protein
MDYRIMGYYFTSMQIIVGAIVLLVVVLIVAGALIERRKNRTQGFRDRFGSEYDRAVLDIGSTHEAEAILAGRETRVEAMEIRNLSVKEREIYVSEWNSIQSRFIDHPKSAVTEANALVDALQENRGYPRVGFDQRAADVSVDYPGIMEDYRIAHSVAVRMSRLEATTEELRAALIQYRTIFDQLIQDRVLRESRAAA